MGGWVQVRPQNNIETSQQNTLKVQKNTQPLHQKYYIHSVRWSYENSVISNDPKCVCIYIYIHMWFAIEFERCNHKLYICVGSAITGPIGKECADLWPRIASAANAIV